MTRSHIPQDHADPFLTTREAALLLGVSLRSVQNYVERGYLHAGRTPGGHRRIRTSDVHALAEKMGIKTPESAGEPVALIRTWHKGYDQHAELVDWSGGIDSLADGEHRLYAAQIGAARALLTDEQILSCGPGQEDAVWNYESQIYFARAVLSLAAMGCQSPEPAASPLQAQLDDTHRQIAERDELIATLRARLFVPDIGAEQDWSTVDGAVAWHLIDRSGDGWGHIGAMMNAWRDAHPELTRLSTELADYKRRAEASAGFLVEAEAVCSANAVDIRQLRAEVEQLQTQLDAANLAWVTL